ncbi:MAG: hypothetical protein R2817_13750, partial [Flavobacteriales bacterium]
MYRPYRSPFALPLFLLLSFPVVASSGIGGGPANDLCTNVTAEDLAIGASLTFTGNNTGATFDGDAGPGSFMDLGLPSVWHAFTTTDCADVTI